MYANTNKEQEGRCGGTLPGGSDTMYVTHESEDSYCSERTNPLTHNSFDVLCVYVASHTKQFSTSLRTPTRFLYGSVQFWQYPPGVSVNSTL